MVVARVVEARELVVMEAAVADGGRVHHGPMEVPGPAYIAVLQDPAGAWFAVTGLER